MSGGLPFRSVLVAGGAGFIGSRFVTRLLSEYGDVSVVNYDKLTYAGNPENLAEVEGDPRHTFVRGDICDEEALVAAGRGCDAIVNFAAETHVDRSIVDPEVFLRTDVLGSHHLMSAARTLGVRKVVQVSTDEVYGSIDSGHVDENARLAPSSPYSAGKAGGDLIALAFNTTWGLPVCVTRGSNTYGPRQYPEKLIPLFVTNALEGVPLPLYGDGMQRRDWLHVDDHCRGILHVLVNGVPGEVYNVAGGNERTNREITGHILDELGLDWDECVRHVDDRPGHDVRYAVSDAKLRALGWAPTVDFEQGIREAVRWYRDNEPWWRRIKDGSAFAEWREAWYSERSGS